MCNAGALASLAEVAEGVVEGQQEDRQEPRAAQPGVQREQGANQVSAAGRVTDLSLVDIKSPQKIPVVF